MFGVVNRLSLSVDRLFSNGAEGLFHYVISANTMIGLYADYCHWNEIKNCRQNKRCQIRSFPIHEVSFICEDVVFTVS